MAARLATFFVVLALVNPIVRPQSPAPEASASEKKKARDEHEKQALVLIDQIIKDAQSLKLPENRIRIAISLAGSLWSRDEKRARSLFKDAVTSLGEITAAIESGDPEYFNQSQLPQQLRQEMVQMVAGHDARLAVDFLRATRPAGSASRPPNSGLTNLEAQLEMQAATQIAAKDPEEALRVAEDSLKIALDYQALNLLYTLQSQQKALSEKFLEDILNGIRTSGVGNSPAAPIALNLLRVWVENNRATADPAYQRTVAALSLSNLNEQTARELGNLLINALLSDAPATTVGGFGRTISDGPSSLYIGQTYGIFQQMKPLLPDIEKLAPDRMAALRARGAALEKTYEAQQGPWGKYQELTRTGTPEALMAAAETAPSDIANNLVQQAAWKAINQGDADRAHEIVERIADPAQRAQMKSQMVRQEFNRASEQKNLTEARALLSRLPLEEQVSELVQMASSSTAAGDKPAALKLLGEAQALLADRALNYAQLQTQVQIARAYEDLDAARATSIVERVIDQVNELVAAAVVLNGFDVQGYLRNGEFVINGGNSLNTMVEECGRELGYGARNNVDRARLAAERFQRPEMRLIALLQIAEGALTDDSSGSIVFAPRARDS